MLTDILMYARVVLFGDKLLLSMHGSYFSLLIKYSCTIKGNIFRLYIA